VHEGSEKQEHTEAKEKRGCIGKPFDQILIPPVSVVACPITDDGISGA
jgi:hypothetical protein